MTTRARSSDPHTSHDAATAIEANAPKLRASQARVLAMFKLYGDLHDKALTEYLHDAEHSAGLKLMSPSGVRTRRSELAKPNMDRLDEIAMEMQRQKGEPLSRAFGAFASLTADGSQDAARARLRIEGFRSPLWDTGKRVVVDGRTVIVWGLAR